MQDQEEAQQWNDRNDSLAEIVVGYASGSRGGDALTEQDRVTLKSLIVHYLNDRNTIEDLKLLLMQKMGSSQALDYLNEILNVPAQPLQRQSSGTRRKGHKDKRYWTAQEDMRLIAGLYRMGSGCWTRISDFVGNGRTRVQCHQRWCRVLDPRLKKGSWKDEELRQLVQLAESEQKLSWGEIAKRIGTKCDLQCRYKYERLTAVEREHARESAGGRRTIADIIGDTSFEQSVLNDLSWLDADVQTIW